MTRPLTYRPLTIHSGIVAGAARTPSRVAVEHADRQLTFAGLVDRLGRFANLVLANARDRPDHGPPRVGILMPNCLEFIEIVTGTSACGGIAVPLNPTAAPGELAQIVGDADLDMVVAGAVAPELIEAVRDASKATFVSLGEHYEQMLGLASSTLPDIVIDEWQPFLVSYTGGTTGTPKGVVLSHRSRVLTFMGMGIEYGCYTPFDRSLCVAPLCHGAGFAHALAPLFFGGSCRILSKFEPELSLREMVDPAITNVFMVPTHFAAIFALDDLLLHQATFAHLSAVISNAAPLSIPLKRQIVDVMGPDLLFEAYGSTEAGTVTMIRPADQLRKGGSVGLPFVATTVRFMDGDGSELPANEPGELYSQSPYLFNEYLNRPDETTAALVNGWFSSGDIGYRDSDGYIYLLDRTNDKIVSGGVNVYPREVESLLEQHSGVREAAVFGVPDDYWGEAVRAVVVLHVGATVTESELDSLCRRELAPAKRPKVIEFHDVLPRSATGKLLRRTLREPYWGDRARQI